MKMHEIRIEQYIMNPSDAGFFKIQKLINKISKNEIENLLNRMINKLKVEKSVLIYNHIGLLFMFLGKNIEAQYYFTEGHKKDSKNIDIIFNLGQIAAIRQDIYSLAWCVEQFKKNSFDNDFVMLMELNLAFITGQKNKVPRIAHLLVKSISRDYRIARSLFEASIRCNDAELAMKIVDSKYSAEILKQLNKRDKSVFENLILKK